MCPPTDHAYTCSCLYVMPTHHAYTSWMLGFQHLLDYPQIPFCKAWLWNQWFCVVCNHLSLDLLKPWGLSYWRHFAVPQTLRSATQRSPTLRILCFNCFETEALGSVKQTHAHNGRNICWQKLSCKCLWSQGNWLCLIPGWVQAWGCLVLLL